MITKYSERLVDRWKQLGDIKEQNMAGGI